VVYSFEPIVAVAYGVLQGYPYRPSPQATALTNSRVQSKVPNTTPIEWGVILDPYLVKEKEKDCRHRSNHSYISYLQVLSLECYYHMDL